jgi:predicted ATPase/DNA-binding SARP family transcriptional activator/Tfp pilus assembly protein PilF
MSSTFHLRFLGPVQVEQDDEPLRGFRSRKALALLGYLVTQGQALPRERLADLFWEDQTESRGRANLSWVLNKLKALLPDCLETDRHNVQFQRADPYWLDLDAFDQLETRGETSALAEAVELYRGEFLEGLYLEGCAEFELWVLAERERWRQRVLRALETLVAHHSQRGEYEASLHFARRLLALEPWREATHRQVMRLLARSGQRGAALAQYEACRRILAAELGVEPALETTALYERIQAADSRRHDLPAQPTPFLGRKEELVEIAQLLDDPDCRLLTLLGPGGIGKTRLALQAGEAKREAFLEGVHFVPLVALGSGDFLVSAIADALQFSLSSSGDPQLQLLNYLRGKEVLLILDNFEHLLQRAELLGEILEKAPEVKLLVTSRERLNLRWEKCFEIAGLDYPSAMLPGKALQAYSAVQLFQQTARQVRQDFALSDQDRPAVARICQLTEGLPLGIELAAAWTGVYTCQEIAEEIERGLDFLATSLRDVPQRHRSIQATFEYSWRLLAPPEQDILMVLSVFRRGFQRKAAKEVTGATPMVLKSLVDKSLLRFLPSGRYEMHELLRQYVAEKLAALPKARNGARDRHCAYYTTFLGRQEDALTGADATAALAEVRAEIANVRGAWRWAVQGGRLEEIERGLNGLSRYYLLTGPFQEGERLIEGAVDCARAWVDQGDRPEREAREILSRLLVEQARFLNRQGMYQQAIVAAQEAIDLARISQALQSEAVGYLQWGHALGGQGEFKTAQIQLEQALALARATSLPYVEAEAVHFLGEILWSQGHYAEAKAYYEQSLYISRETGDPWVESDTLKSLGNTCLIQGDYVGAKANYEQALQIQHGIGSRLLEGQLLSNLALVSHHWGDYAEAKANYKQALRVCRELGNRQAEGYTLTNLGNACFEQGDYAQATTCLEQSLRICRETGNRPLEGLTLNSLGLVSTYQGDYAEARAYFDQTLCLSREIGDRRVEGQVLSSLGLLSHCQADDQAAGKYSQQSLHIAQEIGDRRLQGYALTRLGHALTGLGQLSEAANVYQAAVDTRRELKQHKLAIESLAGLALASLVQGELVHAQEQVEEILTHLETGNLDGTDEPCRVYLTCYRVLHAAQDPRAQEVLSAGYCLLQERAAKIGDEELRRSFLENVAAHRELLEEALKAGLGAPDAAL